MNGKALIARAELGDSVAFLRYWRNEAATAEKVRNGWLHARDLAEVDDEGYYRFVGRTDDPISSAGHCISPARSRTASSATPRSRSRP